MKIILASNNQKKIKELKEILNYNNVRSYRDFLDEIEVDESGNSFEENAEIKAETIYKSLQLQDNFFVLSDDSGICVEALNSMPSIYSARFASIKENANKIIQGDFIKPTQSQSDEANNIKLLKCLDELNIKESSAYYMCVISVYGKFNGLNVKQNFVGKCHGKVIKAPLNSNAFGYDPIFIPNGYKVTMDKIEDKNYISHRFKALQQFQTFFQNLK